MTAAPVASQRLFVALWPDDATRNAIAQWQALWHWPPHAAAVRAERLHLTLHFLGNVSATMVPRLHEALDVRWNPFTLELGVPDVWGNGVAVLRPHHTPAALEALHTSLATALTRIGLSLEARPYRPHVTLARRASHARPPQENIHVPWRAAGHVLVRTLPAGGRYEIIGRWDAA